MKGTNLKENLSMGNVLVLDISPLSVHTLLGFAELVKTHKYSLLYFFFLSENFLLSQFFFKFLAPLVVGPFNSIVKPDGLYQALEAE